MRSNFQTELEFPVVARSLIPEEFERSQEVGVLGPGLESYQLMEGIELSQRGGGLANLLSLPVVRPSGEVAGDPGLGVSRGHLTLSRVAVTEAGSAAEVVVQVDVEMSRLAPVAPLALHVLFTETISRLSVTAGSVAQTSLHHTLAGLTAPTGSVREVPVVGLALVALVSRHPGLTLTRTLTGTLEVGGAGGVAVTGQTGLAALGILHWRDVVVVLAQLAVGSTPVAPAVLTLSAPPALYVKFLVKPTLSGPVVTLAGWI